jgi:hypothetical protein
VSLLVNTFFGERLQDLLGLAARVGSLSARQALSTGWWWPGGLSLYVEEAEEDAGRLTKDIDIVVHRADLARIAEAVVPFGLEYRQAAGIDMLLQKGKAPGRRAVHLMFDGADPGVGPTLQGIPVVPLADLVRMKLTSFRIKDEMHVKDLDEVRLITPEIEAALSPILRERLAQVRARD